MTFDLLFYNRESEPILNVGEMITVVSHNPQFVVRQVKGGYDFFYENKLTGVYFMMDYSPEDEAPRFPGFKKTGLSALVNFARPTYFALEAFPVISGIAESLSLQVLDDQFSSHAKTPSECDAKMLTDSWTKSNEWGVRAAWSHGEKMYYMPREQLDYLWKYLTLTNDLQQRVDVFVPTKVLAFKEKFGRLVTCCLWPNYMPQVFPIVDFVLIGAGQAQPQPSWKVRGFARLSEIRNALQGIIKEVKEPVQHILLSEELAGQTLKTLDQIALVSPQDFAGVSWDQVVDVPPQQ